MNNMNVLIITWLWLTWIIQVSSSKGSDGHTLAITSTGALYSWGDGDFGKLGHGNNYVQKSPKLVQGPLADQVR